MNPTDHEVPVLKGSRGRSKSKVVDEAAACTAVGDSISLVERWHTLSPEERSKVWQQNASLPRSQVVDALRQSVNISSEHAEALLDDVYASRSLEPEPELVGCPDLQAAVNSGIVGVCIVPASVVLDQDHLQMGCDTFTDNCKPTYIEMEDRSSSSSTIVLSVEKPIFQVPIRLHPDLRSRSRLSIRYVVKPATCCGASAAYQDLPAAGRVIVRWEFTSADVCSVMAGTKRTESVSCAAVSMSSAAPVVADPLYDCTGVRRIDATSDTPTSVNVHINCKIYRQGEHYMVDKLKLHIPAADGIILSQWGLPIGASSADLPECRSDGSGSTCEICHVLKLAAGDRNNSKSKRLIGFFGGTYGLLESAQSANFKALVRARTQDMYITLDRNFLHSTLNTSSTSTSTLNSALQNDDRELKALRIRYTHLNEELRLLWDQIKRSEADMVQIETRHIYKNEWMGPPAPDCINNMCRADPGYIFGMDIICFEGKTSTVWRGGSYEIAGYSHNGPIDRHPMWRFLDMMTLVAQVAAHLMSEDAPSALRPGFEARLAEFGAESPSARQRMCIRHALVICRDFLDRIHRRFNFVAISLRQELTDVRQPVLDTVSLGRFLARTLLDHNIDDPEARAGAAFEMLKATAAANFEENEGGLEQYIFLAYRWMIQLLRLEELKSDMAELRGDLFQAGVRIWLRKSRQLATERLVSFLVSKHFFDGLQAFLVERSESACRSLLASVDSSAPAGAGHGAGPSSSGKKKKKKQAPQNAATATGPSALQPSAASAGAPSVPLASSANLEAEAVEMSVSSVPPASVPAGRQSDEDAELLAQLLELAEPKPRQAPEAPLNVEAGRAKLKLADAKAKGRAEATAVVAEAEARGRMEAAAAVAARAQLAKPELEAKESVELRASLAAAAAAQLALRAQLAQVDVDRERMAAKGRADAAELAALRAQLAVAERQAVESRARAEAAEAEAARARTEAARAAAESAQAKAEAKAEASALRAQLAGAIQTSDERLRGMSAADLRVLCDSLQEATGRAVRWHLQAAQREAAAVAAARPLEFECGVCLERRPLAARRTLCLRGHVFCLSCCTSLRARGEPCPNCRTDIIDAIPVLDALQR